MKPPSFLIVLALWFVGCQAQTLPEPHVPSGTYTNCARGVHNPDGNIFLNSAGFESTALLTLSQSGPAVKATYVDQNGLSQSLNFTTLTAASFVLAQPAQVSAGLSGLCVQRPMSSAPYPATMHATAGAMTYYSGTIFVTLTGRLVSEAGRCGRLTQPDAAFWLLCRERAGGPPLAGDATPVPITRLPAGAYACRSQVESSAQFNGMRNDAGGGGTGTLMLAQDGAQVSAAYAGDAYLAGTLRFGLTTSTTAGAETGQALQTPCTIPRGRAIPQPTPQPLPVTAGSLTLVGSRLFVSFTGTMGAACADAQVAGTLICSKQP